MAGLPPPSFSTPQRSAGARLQPPLFHGCSYYHDNLGDRCGARLDVEEFARGRNRKARPGHTATGANRQKGLGETGWGGPSIDVIFGERREDMAATLQDVLLEGGFNSG